MAPSATSMQIITAFCAIVVAGSVFAFTVHTWSEARNAQLVQIGVGILEIDPDKNKQSAPAREWAIDLIEANAGVKFSPEARAEMLHKPLVTSFGGTQLGGGNQAGTQLGGGNPGGRADVIPGTPNATQDRPDR